MSSIGIFDSGLGGLAILKEILAVLPQYNYLYLGDNARVPYGGRSPELIYQYTRDAVHYLFEQDCELIILACNSATVASLRKIQQQLLPKKYPNKRVLGVVIPSIETAIERGEKRIGIIATQTTVNSNVFPVELTKQKENIHVFQQSCPLLVPIIEAGETSWEGLDLILNKYLFNLKQQSIESLILGCTHYGLIQSQIKSHLGPNVHIINQGEATANKLKDYLDRHPEIEAKIKKNSKRQYHVTDHTQQYQAMASTFMGKSIYLTKVDL